MEVDVQLISQLLNIRLFLGISLMERIRHTYHSILMVYIRLFLNIFLMECIQYICLNILMEHTQFNIRQHNSLLPFFPLEHIQFY